MHDGFWPSAWLRPSLDSGQRAALFAITPWDFVGQESGVQYEWNR